MTWPSVQLRHIAHFAYGDSLADSDRLEGRVPVYGSNGQVGLHDRPNTRGPVVVIGRKGSFGKVQYSPEPVFAIDTTFFVDASQTSANLRWLYYALSMMSLDSLSEDVGVPGLSRERAYQQRVPLPPPEQQRTIACYLDGETARINALIEKKQRMVSLANIRLWTAIVDQVLQVDAPLLPVRRVLMFLTDGPFGSAFSSADYSTEGAAVVRLGNIGFSDYRTGDQVFIPIEMYRSFLRYQVLPGDVLIAGLGDPANHPGRACVAPDLGPAMVKGKCFCARVDTSRVEPQYLALLLSSPYGAGVVGASGRGSTRTMINLEIIKDTVLPFPDLATQRLIIDEAGRSRSTTESLVSRLAQQIEVLQEHRQALITATVTGELEVPGVAA